MSILYDYQPRSKVLVIDRKRVRSIGSTNQKTKQNNNNPPRKTKQRKPHVSTDIK